MRPTSILAVAQELSESPHPFGVVVICTRDRPDEIEMSCTAAHAASPNIDILVVDASATEATQEVCAGLARRYGPSFRLLYRRAQKPGLARQRNEAIDVCHDLGVEVIHFIDDDTEVSAGYFEAIERRFSQDSTVMGLGGIITNQQTVSHLAIRSFFLLASRRFGSVLRSGRNMPGQYPGTQASDPADWLSGCSMSYRVQAFSEAMFDGRLEGPSLGEDYDFSFRLSRKYKLAVEPKATCIHHVVPAARGSMRESVRISTQNTYRWVSENRALGMSRVAFWWSALGNIMLHAFPWIVSGNRDSKQETLGILEGVIAIVRNPNRSPNLYT